MALKNPAMPSLQVNPLRPTMSHATPTMTQSFYCRAGKRWFDAACALFGLIVLSPLLFLVALFVKLTSSGPAFFRQVRIGQFGRPFQIFKFRTMKHSPSGSGPLLTAEGDARITPFGKWLRKSKVDELPQLINVLLGDMSLVSPRPEVPRYVGEYTDRQKKILLLKPGITGPSANVYEEQLLAGHLDKETFYLTTILPAKLEIDIAYCESVSFTEDVRLILQTFWKIFMRMMELQKPLQRPSQTQI
jgi:lipopolysaccharide/colanic/teichoic acid biosynthesis glycosyltransferase